MIANIFFANEVFFNIFIGDTVTTDDTDLSAETFSRYSSWISVPSFIICKRTGDYDV